MQCCQVVLREANLRYDHPYSYTVPDALQADIEIGRRVLVPFGSGDRTREAFVWSLEDTAPFGQTLKAITAVLDEGPVLLPDQLQLAAQMKMRYACTYGEAIKAMLPVGTGVQVHDWIRLGPKPEGLPDELVTLLTKEGEVALDQLQEMGLSRAKLLNWVRAEALVRGERLAQRVKAKTVRWCRLTAAWADEVEILTSELITSLQQETVVQVLMYDGPQVLADLLMELRVSRSVIKGLEQKRIVEVYDAPPNESETAVVDDIEVEPSAIPRLTEEQQVAVNTLVDVPTEVGVLHEFLLFGVTGSGKTEVYLRLVAEKLGRGQQAIILVPEIALTPQTVRRFQARFGTRLAVLHSRLTIRERYDEWRRIRAGDVDVVIGARSAVFAPVQNLGVIVIDEEHESTYFQDSAPRYSAHTIARLRAMAHGAVLVLGSATPSVTTYARAESGRSTRLNLTERPSGAVLPRVEVVDLRQDRGVGPARGIMSRALHEACLSSLSKGEQVMVFLNRRGFSSVLVCEDCGEQVTCPRCSVNMTWHKGRDRLVCHYCGHMVARPSSCPSCHAEAMVSHGFGTEQVETVCQTLFPEAKVLRMDQDTTAGRMGHDRILDAFRQGEADILIGTQMIAKGHDFPKVTTVGILSADQMLAINDYRASERAFQLMTQAAGRAGRKDRPGTVYLQAFDIDDYSVSAASAHDYLGFYKEEMAFRKFLAYPPFGVLGTLTVSGRSERAVQQAILEVGAHVTKACPQVQVAQPVPAPLYKLGDRYRMQVSLRSAREIEMSKALHSARSIVLERGLSLSYGMDPA